MKNIGLCKDNFNELKAQSPSTQAATVNIQLKLKI